MKVAFYGDHGSYSEEAALKYFGGNVELAQYKLMNEVFNAVDGNMTYGVVPIENSIEGPVTNAYDLLLKSNLKIEGETIVKIEHCLLANKGVGITDLKRVYSHSQALGQCKSYLDKLRVDVVPYYDTAGSAKMIHEQGLKDSAAIASERAARIYNLDVIARKISEYEHNYTRFFVISKKETAGKRNKTSIVLLLKHSDSPGTLYDALSCFRKNRVDLTYIQSRPILGRPWEYSFYIDCKGDAKQKNVASALRELEDFSSHVKVLGSYKAADKDKY